MALALTCPLSVFAEKDGGAVPAAATVSSNKISFTAHKKSRTDYLLLVNKTHKLPDDYEAKLDLVTVKNCFGKEFQVERETYAHFTELQADLLKEGIRIELESERLIEMLKCELFVTIFLIHWWLRVFQVHGFSPFSLHFLAHLLYHRRASTSVIAMVRAIFQSA
jgi:hypothetical protein